MQEVLIRGQRHLGTINQFRGRTRAGAREQVPRTAATSARKTRWLAGKGRAGGSSKAAVQEEACLARQAACGLNEQLFRLKGSVPPLRET